MIDQDKLADFLQRLCAEISLATVDQSELSKQKPDRRAATKYKFLYPGSTQIFVVLPRTVNDQTQIVQGSEFLVNQVPSWVIRTGVVRFRVRKCDHGNGNFICYCV